MPFEYQPADVSLSDIDSGVEIYRITTNCDADDLASVIECAGLANPPILKPTANGYIIICGFRRIAAARSLGWRTISARLIDEDAAPLSCALLAISENCIERSLNLIETSRAVAILSSLIPEKNELQETAEKFGLPGNPSLLKKVLPLCRLPLPLQEGVLSGSLALPCIQMLSRLPAETSVVLAEFLTTLKLSLHKQRELIDIVQEISKREDCSIENILESPDICRIFDDPEADLPRKAALIREYLKKRRFPHLTRAETRFEELKSRLKLGNYVFLKPPPGFESNRYTLSMSFGSLTEFEAHRKTLEKISKQKDFVHILSSRDPH